MNVLRKILVSVAGVAALALLLTLAAPRAVHAVVAALVQVVNTPTNAVPAMLAPAASQLYQSTCYKQSGGYGNASCKLDPVPANKTLFVEAVSIAVYVESGNSMDEAYFSAAGDFLWSNPGNFFVPLIKQGSTIWVGNLAGRVHVSASVQPGCNVYFAQNSPSGNIVCQVSGYLAPAQ